MRGWAERYTGTSYFSTKSGYVSPVQAIHYSFFCTHNGVIPAIHHTVQFNTRICIELDSMVNDRYSAAIFTNHIYCSFCQSACPLLMIHCVLFEFVTNGFCPFIQFSLSSDAEHWCFLWSAFEKKNGWVSNRDAGDLRRYRAHYDITMMNIRCPNLFACIASTKTQNRTTWWSWQTVVVLCAKKPQLVG